MDVLAIIQAVLAALIIVLILLQERNSGTSSLLGGDGMGTYQTRRGTERLVFYATIVAVAALAGLALAQLILG